MSTELKCLAVTAAFEGEGWGGVSNAGDGQGWSAFAISWCIGQDTLQPLLLAMHEAGPETFARCCTQPVDQYGGKPMDLSCALLTACTMTVPQAIAWCKAREVNGQPMPHWKAAFRALGAEPGFRAVQLAHVRPYMDGAKADMLRFGFKSERALCLLFDIHVQQGSVGPGSLTRYQAWTSDAMTEREKLMQLARAVGPQGGEWAADVESRKLAIATGSGTVHGAYYDLSRAEYGITDGPMVP